ncbi:hypothetical protein [Cohnella sp. AR92]|uniref:hypothetical protein n=1 Tax=Cohnella sp. AR92 TaxID=648716 RepID=UPI000F8E3190|nr:hypothetical protein [Cohnella sp. AR92]RUS48851.1 hypothetical protein ELR57_00425 [Cohnella sp. AR92]
MSVAISKAWISSVKQNIHGFQQYHNLFERKTPYQSSPFDGIHFVTDKPLTADFLILAALFARVNYHYLQPNQHYMKSYSFGCVRVFVNPKHRNMHIIKIVINPSQGGLTLQQVIDWLVFIVGRTTDVWMKVIHPKIDVAGLDTLECIRSIWWPTYRKKPDYERFKDQTLYLGSRESKQQLVVYDKAKHMKSDSLLTRIELRHKYEKGSEIAFDDFHQQLLLKNWFKEVYLISATEDFIDELLDQFKNKVRKPYIGQTMKSLSPYQRKKILSQLSALNLAVSMSNEYTNQLLRWLSFN